MDICVYVCVSQTICHCAKHLRRFFSHGGRHELTPQLPSDLHMGAVAPTLPYRQFLSVISNFLNKC